MHDKDKLRKGRGLLVIVVCAARSAQDIQQLVVLARSAGWDVRLLATPNAAAFIDQQLLQDLTTHPVELYCTPDSYLCSCTPAAVVVVPVTFNTLKKWASGEADTFALQLLSRWDASTLPILAVPRASKELAQEPAFFPSLALLKQRGVHILYEPDAYPPNNAVPWDTILTTLHALLTR